MSNHKNNSNNSNLTEDYHLPICVSCYAVRVEPSRRHMARPTCMPCGDKAAKDARKSWTVLTPHKQGAMFFTAETAREVAIGINNKGGLVK